MWFWIIVAIVCLILAIVLASGDGVLGKVFGVLFMLCGLAIFCYYSACFAKGCPIGAGDSFAPDYVRVIAIVGSGGSQGEWMFMVVNDGPSPEQGPRLVQVVAREDFVPQPGDLIKLENGTGGPIIVGHTESVVKTITVEAPDSPGPDASK